jgi:hypothetical protein
VPVTRSLRFWSSYHLGHKAESTDHRGLMPRKCTRRSVHSRLSGPTVGSNNGSLRRPITLKGLCRSKSIGADTVFAHRADAVRQNKPTRIGFDGANRSCQFSRVPTAAMAAAKAGAASRSTGHLRTSGKGSRHRSGTGSRTARRYALGTMPSPCFVSLNRSEYGYGSEESRLFR